MAREIKRDERPMNSRHVGWFDGKPWQYNPGDQQCAACYTREQPADAPPPRGYHVSTPHPDGSKWRIFWIFLVLGLVFFCVAAGWLPPELLAYAGGLC